MKLERFRKRESQARWRTDMSSHTGGETDSAVGELLRASRLRSGEELADVARLLRIRRPYLQALEDGRFRDLPGPTYAVGFVRTYANHLGLAGEEVVRRFKAEAAGIGQSSALVFPSPVPEGGVPGGALLLVSVLLAGLAYGGWYVLSTKDRIVAEMVPALPDRLVELVESVRGGFVPTPAPSPRPQETTSTPELTNGASPTAAGLAAPDATAVAEQDIVSETTVVDSTETSTSVLGEAVIHGAPPTIARMAVPVLLPPKPAQVEEIVAPEYATSDVAHQEPAPQMAETPSAIPPSPILPVVAASGISDIDVVGLEATDESTIVGLRGTGSDGPSAVQAAEIPAPPMLEPDANGTVQLTALPERMASGADTGIAATGRQIVVHARTDSWVQVRDGAGNALLLTRLMRAGESYDVPDQPGLRLLTGNAGALDIMVDGELAPPIGPVGAVRRDVALDAEKLLEGTATRQ